eukprot:CAMPEP_0195099954 /NCGR_PEP_ID=MMETSP0448-20130528/60466_1 /TAXON_ID=66468 /ORGANISM="Heterocapsa triquestra, Strain CCMP 448" /LENGTH=148 /DNA_ID=CAMNT_0040134977 /DNA_START=84 /DNA_END=525 /DNA_ORIENTATION=-
MQSTAANECAKRQAIGLKPSDQAPQAIKAYALGLAGARRCAVNSSAKSVGHALALRTPCVKPQLLGFAAAALALVSAAPGLLGDGPARLKVRVAGKAVELARLRRRAALARMRAAPGLLAGRPARRPVLEAGVAVVRDERHRVHGGRL